jgi:hypothetical protein
MRKVPTAPDAGQATRPSSVRSRASQLTDAEAMRLRAALRSLKGLYGSWPCLAEVMGLSQYTLRNIANGSKRGSAATARKAAHAAGVTIDRLLGGLAPADRCPTCGSCRREAA